MKKLALSLFLVLSASTFLFAQNDLQVLTVVKYNKSESITVKQLKSRCDVYQKQMGKPLTLDEKKMVLKSLTEEKLVVQAAAKSGISIPDSAVDQYFMQSIGVNPQTPIKELEDYVLKTQNMSLDQFMIKQSGMNYADYKAYLKNQLLGQQYILSKKQADIQKQKASDDEIRRFYDANKQSFVMADTMKVFLVIVPKGSNANVAKSKCKDLLNSFNGKKLTSQQIITQSSSETAGYQAGEMFLPKSELAAQQIQMELKKIQDIYNQKEGYVTDVIETANDFRFISLIKKYSAKMLALSDVVQPDTTVTVYDYINQNLTQQKQMQYLKVAAQQVADELNKPEYVEQKKTGDALDKLLAW